MPNHVYQKMRIQNWSSETSMINLKKRIFSDKNELDFNKIIPQPDNIFNGNLGDEERKMCLEQNRPNWYDWNIKNWGTKWGAYSFSLKEDDENMLSFDFQTAWNFPKPIIDKVFEIFNDCEIDYLAVDEGGFFTKSVELRDGKRTEKDLKDHCNEFLFALS